MATKSKQREKKHEYWEVLGEEFKKGLTGQTYNNEFTDTCTHTYTRTHTHNGTHQMLRSREAGTEKEEKDFYYGIMPVLFTKEKTLYRH